MTDHYFSATPATRSSRRDVEVTVGQPAGAPPLLLTTDTGTFSHGKLDLGTEVLLRGAPAPPPSGRLLDLGCGSGVLALTLARRSPAAQVVAVDVNERALELTALNAERNGLANVTVGTPDAIDPAARYDLIWSNPPIRVGKQALHQLLTTWLDRLTPAGEAIVVVQKNLGADSLQRWLADNGWPAERRSSSKGYRLLRVGALPNAPR